MQRIDVTARCIDCADLLRSWEFPMTDIGEMQYVNLDMEPHMALRSSLLRKMVLEDTKKAEKKKQWWLHGSLRHSHQRMELSYVLRIASDRTSPLKLFWTVKTRIFFLANPSHAIGFHKVTLGAPMPQPWRGASVQPLFHCVLHKSHNGLPSRAVWELSASAFLSLSHNLRFLLLYVGQNMFNPRTLTMGVIHPEESYGGHFLIDPPFWGVPIKKAAIIERSNMSVEQNNFNLSI